MNVAMISIAIAAFGTVTKELLNDLYDSEVGGRVENI